MKLQTKTREQGTTGIITAFWWFVLIAVLLVPIVYYAWIGDVN